MTVCSSFGCTDGAAVAAAYLHDVMENTDEGYDDLEEKFGREIADLVVALTKNMMLPGPEREREYVRRLAEADWRARLINSPTSSTLLRHTHGPERWHGRGSKEVQTDHGAGRAGCQKAPGDQTGARRTREALEMPEAQVSELCAAPPRRPATVRAPRYDRASAVHPNQAP